MKTTIPFFALAAVMLGTLPASAGDLGAGSHLAGFSLIHDAAPSTDVFERRGRGRSHDNDRRGDDHGGDRGGRDGGGGRSSDDSRADRNDDHRGARSSDDHRANGGHGGRPRVPGGSGCDNPRDVREHAECRA